MKRIIPALAAVVLIAVAAPAGARTPAAHIDVTGQSSVDRMPDQVVVAFSIIANDDAATRATSEANTTYNALTAALRALGIDSAAIRTVRYNVTYNPRPLRPNADDPTRYGFVVTRIVTATSPRTDQVGTIVDAGIAAGVANVNGVSFGLRDSRTAYRTALAAAVADAATQARILAAAAHVRIVRVLSVGAGGAQGAMGAMDVYSVNANAPTVLPPSNLTVTASVSISYQIAP